MTKIKETPTDILIREAATQEVDGFGFRKRMEEWLELKDDAYESFDRDVLT